MRRGGVWVFIVVVSASGASFLHSQESDRREAYQAEIDFPVRPQYPLIPGSTESLMPIPPEGEGPEIQFGIDSLPRSAAVALRREGIPANIGPTIIVSGPQILNPTNTSLPMGFLGKSETAIASSANGRNIIVAWNDANGFLSQDSLGGITRYAFSVDGGQTFSAPLSYPAVDADTMQVITRGDPWLGVTGGMGDTVYAASLAAMSKTFQTVGVIVHRGIFERGALVWDVTRVIRPQMSNDVFDKESIVADTRSGSGSVYVSLTNFVGSLGLLPQIELFRSSDGGVTWNGPTIVSPVNGRSAQGSVVAVGAAGEVYVTWERAAGTDSAAIMIATSTDEGITFGPPQVVARIGSSALFPPVGFNRPRGNDFPRIAVDHSAAHTGRIYIAYQDARNNPPIHTDGFYVNIIRKTKAPTGGVPDADIYLIASDDQGRTWSSPTLVSSQFPSDGLNQFWPVISVGDDGSVNVLYYQDAEVQPVPIDSLATNILVSQGIRRQSTYQSLVDVYWARSLDGGVTFGNPVPVNESTSNWSIAASNITPNFGDYIASVIAANRLYVAWAQNSLYDIDPTPRVNNRYAPSTAFAVVDLTGAPVSRMPADYILTQNYPNPFNPLTEISYDLPVASDVQLTVYNVLGQRIAVLVDAHQDAGKHTVEFDGHRLSSGLYYYRIDTGDFRATKKMLLVR